MDINDYLVQSETLTWSLPTPPQEATEVMSTGVFCSCTVGMGSFIEFDLPNLLIATLKSDNAVWHMYAGMVCLQSKAAVYSVMVTIVCILHLCNGWASCVSVNMVNPCSL